MCNPASFRSVCPAGFDVGAEFGTLLPDDVDVRVADSTAMVRFLVLPRRPDGTEGYSEEQLAALVTRDTMIGVVPARVDTASSSQGRTAP